MVLKEHKGYWTIFYYDRVKKYTRKKSTGFRATQQLRALANAELKKFQLNFLQDKLKYSIPGVVKLSDGLELYLLHKKLRPKTEEIYRLALSHFITAVGDKEIRFIDRKDYSKFLKQIEGKAQNSRAIWSRTLRALWNYFLNPDEDLPDLKYAEQNIIKIVPAKVKPPEPIYDEDLSNILKELKAKTNCTDKRFSRDQYYFIAFILNSGIRISTAVELYWEDINWDEEVINFKNVKIKGKIFQFPITSEIRKLLMEYGVQKRGKVFPYSSNDSTKFWNRIQKDMNLDRRYGIHRTRKTFLSKMAGKIPIDKLAAVTNTDPRTLRKYYVKHEIREIGRQMDEVKIVNLGDSFGDSNSIKTVPDGSGKSAKSNKKLNRRS